MKIVISRINFFKSVSICVHLTTLCSVYVRFATIVVALSYSSHTAAYKFRP